MMLLVISLDQTSHGLWKMSSIFVDRYDVHFHNYNIQLILLLFLTLLLTRLYVFLFVIVAYYLCVGVLISSFIIYQSPQYLCP